MTRLDSIVTMVDCANFSLDLFNSQAALSQITYGDIIVLNKTDLVDEGDVDSLEIRIRDMKQGARILRTSKSQVPLPLILSVGLFESDKYFDTEEEHHDHHHHDHDHDHCDHDHDHHHHDHDHDHHDHSNHLEVDDLLLFPLLVTNLFRFGSSNISSIISYRKAFSALRVFSGLMKVLNVIFFTSVANVLLSKMTNGKVLPKIS